MFTLPLTPVAFARPRFNGRTGNVFDTPKYSKFKRDFKLLIPKEERKKYAVPVTLWVTFNFVRPRTAKRKWPSITPDLDNLVKAVMDAGNAELWIDDCLVCKVHAAKVYTETSASHIEIDVTPLP